MGCINPFYVTPAQVAGDARLYADRQLLMAALPRSKKVAEVGVQFGENAAFILTLGPDELHLIDVDFTLLPGSDKAPDSWRAHVPVPPNLPYVRDNPAVRLYEADGADTLDTFARNSLDWVYVDGDHSFHNSYRDGKAAMRVAPIVVFNDYTNYSIIEGSEYGVMTAVNKLLSENPGWELFAFALQRDGYHDVAIRRR